MRRLIVLMVLAALLCLVTITSSVASAGDLAVWKFDGSAGLTTDSSGNGYNLTNSGVVASSDKAVDAPGTGSAYFDENQTVFSTSVGVDFSSATVLEVSWWAKPLDTSDVGFIFEQGSPNMTSHAMAVAADWENAGNGAKRMCIMVGNGEGGLWVYGITDSNGNDGQWHYYKAILDRNAATENDFVKFYRDGVMSGVLLNAAGSNYNQPFYDGVSGDGKMYVGSRADVANVNRYSGYLDELTFKDVTPVPEPSSFIGLGMMGVGMLGMSWRKKIK